GHFVGNGSKVKIPEFLRQDQKGTVPVRSRIETPLAVRHTGRSENLLSAAEVPMWKVIAQQLKPWRRWSSLPLRLRLPLGRPRANLTHALRNASPPSFSGAPARFGRPAHLAAATFFGIN